LLVREVMRQPRILQEGARYHVTARTHRGERIFDLLATKRFFLEVVLRAKAKFGFRLENLCLMGNHFHFILRPQEGTSLSRIMQWILSVFAMAWNRENGYSGQGSVWGQRFFSTILTTLNHYLKTFSYIDANPVVAGLVSDSEDWDFGGPSLRKGGFGELLDDPPDEFGLQVHR